MIFKKVECESNKKVAKDTYFLIAVTYKDIFFMKYATKTQIFLTKKLNIYIFNAYFLLLKP